MALLDIESKILEDAKVEAEAIINEAKTVLTDELVKAQAGYEQELVQIREQIEQNAKLSREQFQQSLSLDKEKQILVQKRKWLSKVQKDIITDILASNELLTRYYQNILKEVWLASSLEKPNSIQIASKHQAIIEVLMRQLNINSKLIPNPNWEPGQIEFSFANSKIDPSLKPAVLESLLKVEAKLEEALFPHKELTASNV